MSKKEIKSNVDTMTICNPNYKDDSLNLFSDLKSSNKKVKLLVDIRATHSGYLLNRRVYPGAFMRDAVPSWVTPFNKPILTHHDGYSDPIGRAIEAKYFQLKTGADFDRDYQKPDQGLKLGSGFIVLKQEINSLDAIEKILDKRYLTVSTAHKSNVNICSVCGIDWNQDKEMECTHVPGRSYKTKDSEEQLCYLINGPMQYDECSWVNDPAQINTKVLNLEIKQDSDRKDFLNNDYPCSVGSLLLCDYNGNSEQLLLRNEKDNKFSDNVMNLLSKKTFTFNGINMDEKIDGKIDELKKDLKNLDDKSKDEIKDKGEKTEPNNDKTVTNKEEVNKDTLSELVTSLTDTNKTLKDENKKLVEQVSVKDSLVTKLTNELTQAKQSLVAESAKQLAMARVVLRKAGTDSVKDAASFEKFAETLTKRTYESIKDALTDLLPELDALYKAKPKLYTDSKVESIVPTNKDHTNVKADKVEDDKKGLRSKADLAKDLL